MLATPPSMQSQSKASFGDEVQRTLERVLHEPFFPYSRSSTFSRQHAYDEPEILSASQYPQGLVQDYQTNKIVGKRRKASQLLHNGVEFSGPFRDLDGSSSSELDTQPSVEVETSRPHKKSKKSLSQNDDKYVLLPDKKQRGRPRLDTQDATAADRRRTQIRLAQRAYRHRKETTISGLKKRVTELHNTVEQMNKTFTQLRDNIEDSGVLNAGNGSKLSKQLQIAIGQFTSLAKISSDAESEDEAEKIAEITKIRKGTKNQRINLGGRRGSMMANLVKEKDHGSSSSDIEDDDDMLLGFQIQRGSNETADPQLVPMASTNEEDLELLPLFSKIDDDSLNFWPLPTVTDIEQGDVFTDPPPSFDLVHGLNSKSHIERPLSNPAQADGFYTYSFQEVTFARRIHRMCLERAYRNLCNPTIEPGYAERTFRFTFCFASRKRMIARFQELLKRKAGESLENYNVPFVHIGGAGTHFPRRDKDGRPIYPPNMVDPARLIYSGPQTLSLEVETPMPQKTIPEILEAIGYGGEWYDSHDVDEYLKSIGVHIDGHSSFVEVDPRSAAVTMLMSPPSSSTIGSLPLSNSSESGTSSASRSPFLPRTPSPPTFGRQSNGSGNNGNNDSFAISQPYPRFPFPNIQMDTNMDMDVDLYSQFDGTATKSSTLSFIQPTPSQSANAGGVMTGMLTFDVESFLQRLLDDSRCLGRAPGFRKQTIDEAIRWSLSFGF